MAGKGDDNGNRRSTLQALGFVSGIGIQFAVMIGVCIFIGKQADYFFAIAPWGTLIGIVCGFVVGIWATYKKLLDKSA